MIDAVEINNFRCFHQTKMSGFKSINLIGGKNNSGKTALLEAIYCVEKEDNYQRILTERYENLDTNHREKNLFYNYDINKEAEIKIFFSGESEYKSFAYNYTDVIKVSEKGTNIYFNPFDPQPQQRGFPYASSLIFSKNAQLPYNLNLSEEFDKADIQGESKIILEALQIIDSTIEEIKTYSSKPNMLYLRKKNEKILTPINDFGDALQKFMRYIITIMNLSKENLNIDKCLLIDEIENGLHFTTHEVFWKMLFKLAKAYSIQVFATSHSLEMISAFNKVAYQTEFEQDAMYFEMSRHVKTKEIIANPMDMQMLHYEITKNNTFRGE